MLGATTRWCFDIAGLGALLRAAMAAGASDRGGDDLRMTARTSRLGAGGGRGLQAQNLAQVFFGAAQCASASWRNASKSAACSVVGGGNGRLRGRPAPGRVPPQPPLRILAIAVDCLITAVGSQGDLPCALPSAWRKEMLSRRARNLMPLADVTGFLIHGSSFQ
jgi:hypothetical protein